MTRQEEITEKLKEKVRMLPMKPGVYIMLDKNGGVIYVGKAKILPNRLSQYFQDTASHNDKTRKMVSQVCDFDVILASSEFEALTLENSLIKRHMPKYNILLKDDKGYPYIRLGIKDEYPRFSIAPKPEKDGAAYYGPYSGRGVAKSIIDAVCTSLKLPTCSKSFPRDIGRDRPCLEYHMKRCEGWCADQSLKPEYDKAISQAKEILEGNYARAAEEVENLMLQASERLEFEKAAFYRDRREMILKLGRRQHFSCGSMTDTDAAAWRSGVSCGCLAVMHYSAGTLVGKDTIKTEGSSGECEEDIILRLLAQYYQNRGYAPCEIMLGCEPDGLAAAEEFLRKVRGGAVHLITPVKGEKAAHVRLAAENAQHEADMASSREERRAKTLQLLGKMIKTEKLDRIESYDISHTAGEDAVGAMVVFQNGKPLKRDYRLFDIKTARGGDDCASMREILKRRVERALAHDEKFPPLPDLILMDGALMQVQAAGSVLKEYKIDIPVFGMVKDEKHRTRALVDENGCEIGIVSKPAVFSFIGTIQEEVHRFAIGAHDKKRTKHIKQSQLENIPGVGKVRRAALLKEFKSVKAIKQLSVEQLKAVLPENAAISVWQYFHAKESGKEDKQ